MLKNLVTSLLAIAGLLFPASLHAQDLGNVGLRSVTATLATNTTCTGAAQTFSTTSSTLNTAGFRNLGQNLHAVTLAVTGTTAAKAEIDGVDNAGNVYRISDVLEIANGVNTVGSAIYGAGYYPNIQVVVTCSPGTATFTLSYAGGFYTFNGNFGSYLLGQIDKSIFNGAAANVSATSPTFQTPYGSSYGTILFVFNLGGPAGSSLVVTCVSNVPLPPLTIPLGTSAVNQAFPINIGPCPLVQVQYVSGGASANTYSLEYIFSSPGTPLGSATANFLGSALNGSAILAEKGARWDVLSTPAAGAQATASKAAGASGVRHVADCVSYSAGAIAAPIATALQINLRDGATGAGTILWSKTVAIPATAAPHYDGNFCGLNLIGSSATAMTLEFSALLASESQSVTLTGYDVQ